MAVPTNILDSDSGVTAKVTKFGELVVGRLQYSTPVTDELDVIDTAFNFIQPQQDHSIVITDIFVDADKSVSNTTPADVEIYEATTADTTTIDTGILSPRLLRGANRTATGLNMIVPEGKFVNAKTNDDVMTVTIMFYRVPAENV